jgi:hypothetical protein
MIYFKTMPIRLQDMPFSPALFPLPLQALKHPMRCRQQLVVLPEAAHQLQADGQAFLAGGEWQMDAG